MIHISIPVENLASLIIGVVFFGRLGYLVYITHMKNKPIQYVKTRGR
jgi:hypothetical protein